MARTEAALLDQIERVENRSCRLARIVPGDDGVRSDGLVSHARRHDQDRTAAAHQRDLGKIAPGVGNLVARLAANHEVRAAALRCDRIGAHDIGRNVAAPFMRDRAAMKNVLERALGSGGGIVACFLQPVDDLLGDFRWEFAVNRQVGREMQSNYVSASWRPQS